MRLTVHDVGRMFGMTLPAAPGKSKCPLRKHVRQDKTFRVFKSASGDDVWKCWSCDPPDNVGDAVALYAKLAGISRTDAWKKLKDMGHEVPGHDREPTGRSRRADPPRPAEPAKPKIGIKGVKVDKVLPLAKDAVDAWAKLDGSAVDAFMRSRGFPESFDHRAFGVMPMPKGCVGFLYRDPMTGKPCRVKVRGLKQKVFWNEPRPNPDMPGAKALAPLFLADRLCIGEAPMDAVVITEGELDALSLASLGLPNVVSLPDGAESAGTVSLEPLCGIFPTWFVAVDNDEPGEKAWRVLRDRARAAGAEPVRVVWARMEGEELITCKDANEALAHGFTREDIDHALRVSLPRGRAA